MFVLPPCKFALVCMVYGLLARAVTVCLHHCSRCCAMHSRNVHMQGKQKHKYPALPGLDTCLYTSMSLPCRHKMCITTMGTSVACMPSLMLSCVSLSCDACCCLCLLHLWPCRTTSLLSRRRRCAVRTSGLSTKPRSHTHLLTTPPSAGEWHLQDAAYLPPYATAAHACMLCFAGP